MEDVVGIPFEVGDSAAGSGVAGVQEAEEVVKNIVPGFSEPDQPVDKSGKNRETLLEHIEHVFHDVATTLDRTLHISSNRNVQTDIEKETNRREKGDQEESTLQVTATEEEKRQEDLSPDAAAAKTNDEPSENEPLTEEIAEEKTEEKTEAKANEKSSLFSQMFKRIGQFFNISEGRKKRQSDVSFNPFLPDDEVVTDVTIPEDRVSI